MNEVLLTGFSSNDADVLGVVVDQEDKFIKFSAGGAIKKVLTDPLKTYGGKTVGEANIAWLHEKLNEWINKQLEKSE